MSTLTKLGNIVNKYPYHKNLIINGGFDVWQRGNLFTTGGLTADRWLMVLNGGSQDTVSLQPVAATAGYRFSGRTPVNYLRMTITANGGQNNNLLHYIEDVRTAEQQTVTASMWVYSSTGFSGGYLHIAQNFGVGGSTQVVPLSEPVTVAASTWTKIVGTVYMPSISGKTIGSSDKVSLILQIPGNLTQVVYVSNAQLEIGNDATDFEYRSPAEELALCQRYYEMDATSHSENICTYSSGSYYGTARAFKVTKRIVPSMSFSGAQWFQGVWTNVETLIPVKGVDGFSFYGAHTAAGWTAYNSILWHMTWTADAEIS